ncbi:MAG: class I SAM-dependent methyltransferase [Acidimicrobiia bacterium]|nr:class I SAM-dependent methyltransferase [Acidimicrobiia bacterium]
MVRDLLHRRGYVVERTFAPDYEPEIRETVAAVRPYTMTSIHRVAAVCTATRHVVRHRIPGAIVECGVWKGGSSMAAALTLVKAGARAREIYLYDTFEGIPKPDAHDDVVALNGESALDIWHRENARSRDGAWLEAPIEQVRANMATTGYDMDRVHLVKGLVEDTVAKTAPDQIAVLRLDTDWYGSTKLEMEELFPRLSPGGILIIDDYGHLEGARRAVDEYLATYPQPVFLSRIDYSGRLAVKPG